MEVLLKPSPNQMALHLSESWFVSKKATIVRSGTVSLVCLKQHNILHCSPWMTSLWPHFCQARPTFIVIMGQWQAQVTIALFKLEWKLLINTIFEMFLLLIFSGCHESVIWTVFRQVLSISEGQLSFFRGLKDSSGQSLNDNFRPVQPLYHR